MLDTDTQTLVQDAATAAVDTKAFSLSAYDVAALTSYTDAFLMVSASSERHLTAVADRIERRLRDTGRRVLHREGEPAGGWVLLDYGELIVHLFTEQRRSYYNLDALWGDAPRVGLEGVDERTGNASGSR